MKLALLLFSCVAGAQTFEVATVKPAAPGAPVPNVPAVILNNPMADQLRFRGGPGSNSPVRIDYYGVTLKVLLERAYDVKPSQISGPGWLENERYDITATMAPGTTTIQMREMLRQLLAERFQSSLHHETKSLPVYLLSVVKGGHKMKPGTPPIEPKNEEERQAMQKARMQALEDGLKARIASGDTGPRSSFFNDNGTMAALAENVSREVKRPVRDRTELAGTFTYRVEFVPDSASLAVNSTGLPIYAALEAQLGLHLQAENEPSDILVIDRAERVPTSN